MSENNTKSRNFKLILGSLPSDKHDEIQPLLPYAQQLDKIQSVKNVMNSEGGRILIDGLRSSGSSILTNLLKNYHELSRDEICGHLARLEQNLIVLLALQGVEGKERQYQEIIDTELKRIAEGK